jgi:hypothetical protein
MPNDFCLNRGRCIQLGQPGAQAVGGFVQQVISLAETEAG